MRRQKKLSHFTDIETSWAKAYIEYLAERGFIKGKTETTFAPNDWITRAEFVQILAPDWFMPAVAWAKEMGIVLGNGTYFNPQETITRQDMAVMLYRYMSQVQHYTLETATKRELFADDEVIKAYAKKAVYAMKQADIIGAILHSLIGKQLKVLYGPADVKGRAYHKGHFCTKGRR